MEPSHRELLIRAELPDTASRLLGASVSFELNDRQSSRPVQGRVTGLEFEPGRLSVSVSTDSQPWPLHLWHDGRWSQYPGTIAVNLFRVLDDTCVGCYRHLLETVGLPGDPDHVLGMGVRFRRGPFSSEERGTITGIDFHDASVPGIAQYIRLTIDAGRKIYDGPMPDPFRFVRGPSDRHWRGYYTSLGAVDDDDDDGLPVNDFVLA